MLIQGVKSPGGVGGGRQNAVPLPESQLEGRATVYGMDVGCLLHLGSMFGRDILGKKEWEVSPKQSGKQQRWWKHSHKHTRRREGTPEVRL